MPFPVRIETPELALLADRPLAEGLAMHNVLEAARRRYHSIAVLLTLLVVFAVSLLIGLTTEEYGAAVFTAIALLCTGVMLGGYLADRITTRMLRRMVVDPSRFASRPSIPTGEAVESLIGQAGDLPFGAVYRAVAPTSNASEVRDALAAVRAEYQGPGLATQARRMPTPAVA